MNLYLDNAATGYVYPEVINTVDYYNRIFYNPSAAYEGGRMIKNEIEKAREKLAALINAEPEEIFFTSGGTEGDNWAVHEGKRRRGHIISTQIEHKAVLNSLIDYNNVTLVKPDMDGYIFAKNVEQEIKKDTVMISVMAANNEVGTLQPIKEIGKIAQINNIIFHTDAVQAFTHIDIDVKRDYIGMMSCSSHKFHGPKGCGFLYADKKIGIEPFIRGGGQEHGMRAGTENVSGILGMVKAAEISLNNMETREKHLKNINNYICDRLKQEIRDCRINGKKEAKLNNNINVSFRNINGRELLALMELDGIYISAGSACNSANKGSHVLEAMGISREYNLGTIRITMDYTMNYRMAEYLVHCMKKNVTLLLKK